MSLIRFVAIVPDQGSAFYRGSPGELMQVPMLKVGIAVIPKPGVFKGGDECEVDWDCAFESEGEAETVRVVERALETIPDDLADCIAPYRFNLSIRLGADEMNTPRHVANALRQAAGAIEAGGGLEGAICTDTSSARVGRYTGCLPGMGKGRGRSTR